MKKRNKLLNRLYEKKIIDLKTLDLALQEKLPEKPFSLPSSCPHYLQKLKADNPLKSKFYTGIDSTLQDNAERIIQKWNKTFFEKNICNSAALIMETATGKILAYCGNLGIQAKDVDMVYAKRSSGSLLKPFLYAAMLDNGMLLPDQLVIDIPTRIGSYKPDNNIPVYRGAVKAGEALSRSLNIPAIMELKKYGITAFLDYLKLCGFTTFTRSADDYGLPLILGGGEITMYEATKAYADMMNKACNRQVLHKHFPISTGAAYLTLQALSDGIRPDDEAMWQIFANSKKIAWKTGTSNGNRDAWAIGTTKDYTVAVWVGNASGRGNKEIKSNTCTAPLLFDLFSSLPTTYWPTSPTDDLEEIQVCKHSGYLAGLDCQDKVKGFKPINATLGFVCPYCKKISVTPDGKYRASVSDMKNEYEGLFPLQKSYFVLPPSVEYFYTKQTLGYRYLPPYLPWHKDTQSSDLQIIFPEDGALIIIPIEIDGKLGATVFQVAERNKDASVYWDIDGEYLGATREKHKISIRPLQGDHILTVTDSNGTVCKRSFSIVTKTD